MKKTIKNVLLLSLMVIVLASCTKVPAGNVGIKFYLLGKEKGLDYEALEPGRYYVGINEELFLFPTYNQSKLWTSDSREGSPTDDNFHFQSIAGLELEASVSVEYHVPAENVPQIFETYKKGLDEITNKVLKNSLRDAFNIASSTRTAEQMYGEGKVDFLHSVDSLAKIEAEQRGIVIDDIFLIGNIVVPPSITKALNAKIEATQLAQQRENELRQTKAEAEKVIAEAEGKAQARLTEAEAEAKANRIVAASLTPTLVDYYKIDRWNGVLPTVTGGATPLIDLRNEK